MRVPEVVLNVPASWPETQFAALSWRSRLAVLLRGAVTIRTGADASVTHVTPFVARKGTFAVAAAVDFATHAKACSQCDDQAWSGCAEGRRLYNDERRARREREWPLEKRGA